MMQNVLAACYDFMMKVPGKSCLNKTPHSYWQVLSSLDWDIVDIHDTNNVYLNSRISANVVHEVTSLGGKQVTTKLWAGNDRAIHFVCGQNLKFSYRILPPV
jgi:hypothetical protein